MKGVMIAPTVTKRTELHFKGGGSDKVYYCWIENVGANYFVKFQYGRRGSTLNSGTKIGPTHAAKAEHVYTAIIKEKTGKGYKITGLAGPVTTSLTPLEAPRTRAAIAAAPVVVGCQLLNPVTEEEMKELITDDNFVFQQKYDGKRMWLGRNAKDGTVNAWNRKGLAITPPEEYQKALDTHFRGFTFILDGEACGPVFWAFDIILLEGLNCRERPYEDRLTNLGMLMRSVKEQNVIRMVTTAVSAIQKRGLIKGVTMAKAEGIVIKDMRAPYTAGRPNSYGPQLKYKLVESASCIVEKVNDKRSVGLFLYRDGSTAEISVGNVTIPVNHEVPKVGDVCEIQYLYAYKGGSLYQPVYLGVRSDIDAAECVLSQLKYKPEE